MSDGFAQQTVRVYYTCGCGVTDAKVLVPARGKSVSLELWMDMMAERVGRDHAGRSPGCRSLTMDNVKIPTPDPERGIGEVEWAADPPWDRGD